MSSKANSMSIAIVKSLSQHANHGTDVGLSIVSAINEDNFIKLRNFLFLSYSPFLLQFLPPGNFPLSRSFDFDGTLVCCLFLLFTFLFIGKQCTNYRNHSANSFYTHLLVLFCYFASSKIISICSLFNRTLALKIG